MHALRTAPALLYLGLTGLLACGGSGSGPTAPGPAVGAVVFEYRAPTTIDEDVRRRFPECVDGVGRTHIHPGWRGFARFDMEVAGARRWTRRFEDVPVGQRQRIRISDPNTCADNPTGASTEGVLANGVALTEVVDTPGSGVEPGLAFTLRADGTVEP